MGIQSLGHRKLFLQEIKKLLHQLTTPQSYDTPAVSCPQYPALTLPHCTSALLSSDPQGSTELQSDARPLSSNDLDPEVLPLDPLPEPHSLISDQESSWESHTTESTPQSTAVSALHCWIDALPDNLLVQVASFMPHTFVLESVLFTSKRWKKIAQDPYLWRVLRLAQLPQSISDLMGKMKLIPKVSRVLDFTSSFISWNKKAISAFDSVLPKVHSLIFATWMPEGKLKNILWYFRRQTEELCFSNFNKALLKNTLRSLDPMKLDLTSLRLPVAKSYDVCRLLEHQTRLVNLQFNMKLFNCTGARLTENLFTLRYLSVGDHDPLLLSKLHNLRTLRLIGREIRPHRIHISAKIHTELQTLYLINFNEVLVEGSFYKLSALEANYCNFDDEFPGLLSGYAPNITDLKLTACNKLSNTVISLPQLKLVSIESHTISELTLDCPLLTFFVLVCGRLKHLRVASDAILNITLQHLPMLQLVELTTPALKVFKATLTTTLNDLVIPSHCITDLSLASTTPKDCITSYFNKQNSGKEVPFEASVPAVRKLELAYQNLNLVNFALLKNITTLKLVNCVVATNLSLCHPNITDLELCCTAETITLENTPKLRKLIIKDCIFMRQFDVNACTSIQSIVLEGLSCLPTSSAVEHPFPHVTLLQMRDIVNPRRQLLFNFPVLKCCKLEKFNFETISLICPDLDTLWLHEGWHLYDIYFPGFDYSTVNSFMPVPPRRNTQGLCVDICKCRALSDDFWSHFPTTFPVDISVVETKFVDAAITLANLEDIRLAGVEFNHITISSYCLTSLKMLEVEYTSLNLSAPNLKAASFVCIPAKLDIPFEYMVKLKKIELVKCKLRDPYELSRQLANLDNLESLELTKVEDLTFLELKSDIIQELLIHRCEIEAILIVSDSMRAISLTGVTQLASLICRCPNARKFKLLHTRRILLHYEELFLPRARKLRLPWRNYMGQWALSIPLRFPNARCIYFDRPVLNPVVTLLVRKLCGAESSSRYRVSKDTTPDRPFEIVDFADDVI